MIVEAVSPEIGWIFIDTLVSNEWVEKRAQQKLGFPYQFEEIRKMASCDPDAYAVLEKIVQNKQLKDKVYQAEQNLTATDEANLNVETGIELLFSGEYQERNIRDLLNAFQGKGFEKRRAILLKHVREHINDGSLSEQVLDQGVKISDLSDFEKGLVFRSKLPDSRPFYRLVESSLHEELVKLFSPTGREEWCKILEKSGLDISNKQIEDAFSERKEDLITMALKRMEDRMIFDLFTGLPKEIEARLSSLLAPSQSQ
jgi:hypothetical protein